MKTKRNLIQIWLLCAAMLPAVVQAQFSYTNNGDGTATITGYTGPGGAVTIPTNINVLTVTGIGDSAFFACTNLTSVTIPDSVTAIGAYAFHGCTSLTNVTIGNSVTSIGDYAFFHCTSLTSVTIPNSVTNIGDRAFGWCTGLTSITVDTNNLSYSSVDGVFFNHLQTTLIACPGGKAGSYTVPNSVTSIGDWAFYECTSLTSVTIPNSVTSIGDAAFYYCTSLTSVTIPDSVTSIGDWAFWLCTSLTSITIPNSVTSLGAWAFYECTSLTSVTIGNGVTNIGDRAFSWCTGLTSITVDTNNLSYSSVDGVLFNHLQTTLIACPGGKAGSYTVPNSVTSIANFAFEECASLTSATIPNSVTSIGYDAFLYCTGLTNVTIGNGVTSIGIYAFYDCTSLTRVTIPDSVTNIGHAAFSDCTGLTSITVDTNNLSYSSLDGVLFNHLQTTLIQCPGGKAGSYTVPNSVTSIGWDAFEYCTGLTNVTIGNSVTSIGAWAFDECYSLTNVTIPDSVTSIGRDAFGNCTNLTSVYFQGNAPSLGENVFYDDNNATVYYLPGTTGWGSTFGDRPTALWRPLVQTRDASFGVRTNQFGFNINWASDRVVVVEACTNLANPVWWPIGTNTLTAGCCYFSDCQWTNCPSRFYRLRSP